MIDGTKLCCKSKLHIFFHSLHKPFFHFLPKHEKTFQVSSTRSKTYNQHQDENHADRHACLRWLCGRSTKIHSKPWEDGFGDLSVQAWGVSFIQPWCRLHEALVAKSRFFEAVPQEQLLPEPNQKTSLWARRCGKQDRRVRQNLRLAHSCTTQDPLSSFFQSLFLIGHRDTSLRTLCNKKHDTVRRAHP